MVAVFMFEYCVSFADYLDLFYRLAGGFGVWLGLRVYLCCSIVLIVLLVSVCA